MILNTLGLDICVTEQVGQGAIGVSVIAGYPTKVAPLRQNLELLLFRGEGYHTQSAWRSVLVVTCIVAAATAVAAVALDKLGCTCLPTMTRRRKSILLAGSHSH